MHPSRLIVTCAALLDFGSILLGWHFFVWRLHLRCSLPRSCWEHCCKPILGCSLLLAVEWSSGTPTAARVTAWRQLPTLTSGRSYGAILQGAPMTGPRDDIAEFIQRVVVFRLENLCGAGTTVSLDDDIVRKLRIDSDDLSFDFIPNVEEELGISVPRKDWSRVHTVQQVCDLLETHYRKRGDLPR
jgi:acyl carrier protein